MAALKSFIIISVCVGVALSYSTGAPKGACGNLTPQHGPVAPQKSAVPYNLGVSASSVNPGQSVRITVQGKDTFKGFLIQARDGRQVPIGRFQVLDQANSQLLECNSAGVSLGWLNLFRMIIKTQLLFSGLDHAQEDRCRNPIGDFRVAGPEGLQGTGSVCWNRSKGWRHLLEHHQVQLRECRLKLLWFHFGQYHHTTSNNIHRPSFINKKRVK